MNTTTQSLAAHMLKTWEGPDSLAVAPIEQPKCDDCGKSSGELTPLPDGTDSPLMLCTPCSLRMARAEALNRELSAHFATPARITVQVAGNVID